MGLIVTSCFWNIKVVIHFSQKNDLNLLCHKTGTRKWKIKTKIKEYITIINDLSKRKFRGTLTWKIPCKIPSKTTTHEFSCTVIFENNSLK